jgi:hypothetical protein
MAEEIYASAYESPIDVETMVKLMGFQGRSGPATAAISSLRQYGLVEGRDQSMKVTSLALRIMHPTSVAERREALLEAVFKPELYSEIRDQFGGKIPAEQVIKSHLVRVNGFNPNGADDFVKVLKENRSYMDMEPTGGDVESTPSQVSTMTKKEAEEVNALDSLLNPESVSDGGKLEILRFRASPSCTVEVRFVGELSQSAIAKTIAFLDLARDNYPE